MKKLVASLQLRGFYRLSKPKPRRVLHALICNKRTFSKYGDYRGRSVDPAVALSRKGLKS